MLDRTHAATAYRNVDMLTLVGLQQFGKFMEALGSDGPHRFEQVCNTSQDHCGPPVC